MRVYFTITFLTERRKLSTFHSKNRAYFKKKKKIEISFETYNPHKTFWSNLFPFVSGKKANLKLYKTDRTVIFCSEGNYSQQRQWNGKLTLQEQNRAETSQGITVKSCNTWKTSTLTYTQIVLKVKTTTR